MLKLYGIYGDETFLRSLKILLKIRITFRETTKQMDSRWSKQLNTKNILAKDAKDDNSRWTVEIFG